MKKIIIFIFDFLIYLLDSVERGKFRGDEFYMRKRIS